MKVVYVVTHVENEHNIIVFENKQDAINLCSPSDSKFGFYEAMYIAK